MDDWPNELRPYLDAREYHALPGISPSRAKPAIESALAYRYATQNPLDATDDMDTGTACHLAVFEPDSMPRRVVVWDGGPRRGKAWDEFANANASKLILTDKQYATVLRVRDRCQSHPAIRAILDAKGDVEISMRWTEETAEGVARCRGRIDLAGPRLVDLKTTFGISDRAIASTVHDRLYHMQMAAYQRGYATVTGEEKPCVLIFAQTKPPYDARVLTVEGPELEQGRKLWTRALETILAAEQSGTYPGIDESESTLVLPAWALDSGDEFALTLDGVAVGM